MVEGFTESVSRRIIPLLSRLVQKEHVGICPPPRIASRCGIPKRDEARPRTSVSWRSFKQRHPALKSTLSDPRNYRLSTGLYPAPPHRGSRLVPASNVKIRPDRCRGQALPRSQAGTSLVPKGQARCRDRPSRRNGLRVSIRRRAQHSIDRPQPPIVEPGAFYPLAWKQKEAGWIPIRPPRERFALASYCLSSTKA